MTGGAGEFARAHLNALLAGGHLSWNDFKTKVVAQYRFANEQEWNRKALNARKGDGMSVETYITKFETFSLHAGYDDERLMEIMERTADNKLLGCLILEKERYMDLETMKRDL